jgi:hypothetical protein
MRRTTVVSLLLATMLVASCGRNTTAPGAPPTTGTTDPAVTAAAATVQPVLRTAFPDTFSGLELRHEVPVLVVYRKPDPRLDAEVSRLAPGVRVEFRDAKYTMTGMEAAGTRVMDDREYWKGRGLTVVAVAPAVDGSGVQVITSNEAGDFASALRERYPAMSFSVRQGGDAVFPMDTVLPPVWSGPPSYSTK